MLKAGMRKASVVGRLDVCLFVCLFVWSVGRSVGWSVGRSAGCWSVDWLVGCFLREFVDFLLLLLIPMN